MDIVDWISWEEAEGRPEAPLEGERYEALSREIVSRNICYGGFWHQHSGGGVPLFDDGSVVRLTMRSWGDLLATIWSREDGADYDYIEFAWYSRWDGPRSGTFGSSPSGSR